MQIREIMTRQVAMVRPGQSITEAAQRMRENDIGCLPVYENDRLIGMVTDRDIAIRAVADGDLEKSVADVMSRQVKYCRDDDDVKVVARNMADIEIRRLPVVDGDKRLVGIVSLANIVHAGKSPGQTMASGVASPH